MPSSSKQQAKTMRAIAHGWQPTGSAAKIPVSVATDFEAADKKVGKYEHKKAGGRVKCSTPQPY